MTSLLECAERGRARKSASFLTSAILHALVLAILVSLGPVPQRLAPKIHSRIELVVPPRPRTERPRLARIPLPRASARPAPVYLTLPKPAAPDIRLPDAPVLAAEPEAAPVALPVPVTVPAPVVRTGVFATPAASHQAAPASRTVGPAGFLNPEAATLARESKLVASAGFDTDGSTPGGVTRAGMARASGFGETAGGGTGRARSIVTATGFSDAPRELPIRPRQQIQNHLPEGGVEILEKPQPVYSEEARRLRIEGEVLLRVRFGASGNVEVLGVIRGLGHGLDERAAAAARGIRFRPARRDGIAADSTAIVHILFQLAS